MTRNYLLFGQEARKKEVRHEVLRAVIFVMTTIEAGNAHEWVIGVGYAVFSNPLATDEGLIALEYHAVSLPENGLLSQGLALKSNASTAPFNLGANDIRLRQRRRF